MQSPWQVQAEQLFGTKWRGMVARLAGVNRSTVHRWATGESAMREDVVKQIDETWRLWR